MFIIPINYQKILKNSHKTIDYNILKKKYIEELIIPSNNILTPYKYQLDAFNEFKKNFTNRAILSLPCGTGKTYISYLCSTLYKQIIIISPLKEFAKQNLKKFIEYDNSVQHQLTIKNSLLVDSEGERDIKNINKFVNENERFIISSTYCSVDIISKLQLDNVLIIIDEFHNLSKNNIINEDDNFYKLLHSDTNILFVSATPRVYELENKYYNDSIFGNTIYNMSFTDAIDNKYITDYKIWLPSIHENNDQLNKELSIYDVTNIIKYKCIYLFSCLLNNGSRKCIIYCIDTNEITDMINGMNELNKFYYINYNINQITSKTNDKQRNIILNKFSDGNNIQLLFSVRILDECIDIPSCDSIYITYPSKSKIRTIQRLSRCIRIDKYNKFKIGNIFIWCDEYDLILETLSGIKEYDIYFKDKIKINKINFYGYNDNNIYITDTKTINNYLIEVKEYKQISWNDKLKLTSEYIDKYHTLPSKYDKNNKKNRNLGEWIIIQKFYYKNNKFIMKNNNIKKLYEEFVKKYKEYMMDNNEIWLNNLKKCEEYINTNKKMPSTKSNINEIKFLGCWINTQKKNYKHNINIMRNSSIKIIYEKFIDDYNEYLDNYKLWVSKLNLVYEYINKNNKCPSTIDKNNDIKKLGLWLAHQKQYLKYGKKKELYELMITNNKHLITNNNTWITNLKLLESYVSKNNKFPSTIDKNNDIKTLGLWLSHQRQNYKLNIMNSNNKIIYEKFIEDYKQYCKNNIWKSNLKLVEDYINKYNKIPSIYDENNKILASWLIHQQKLYKNKKIINNQHIILYELFIDKYKNYLDNSNINIWLKNLKLVEIYINKYHTKPSRNDNNNEIKKLGRWISTQKLNYKNNKNIMLNNNIKESYEIFIDNYKSYL
jgi:superfamily II DNA or RNA helicase